MIKSFSKFFKDENLPYIELRYSNSNNHYKEHLHDTFSIGINEKGKSLYSNKKEKYIFKPNMLAIINPYVVHSCNSTNNIQNKYYMLYLEVDWCLELQKSINKDIKEFKPFSKNLLEDPNLYNKFLELSKIIFSEDFYLTKECAIIDFFTCLFLQDININNKQENDFKEIEQILDYLEKNYKSNIKLKELEDKFKLNSFYIIRLFNKKIGLSPHQYLLNLKINKSKDLLKSGVSIVETALECGFSDQSHFHRNFVDIVAITPKQFQINFIQ